MGAVYRAEDPLLGREVAIEVALSGHRPELVSAKHPLRSPTLVGF